MGGVPMEKYFYFIFSCKIIFISLFILFLILFLITLLLSLSSYHHNLIASHTNSHSNTNTGLIANSNNNNAIRGLMNNIIINNNNNIIICFPFILQQQQESNPRLPLNYTANYDYLILLFITISSRYLIIEQQGIEPYTTSVHHITLTAVLYSCAKVLRNSLALLLWTIHH